VLVAIYGVPGWAAAPASGCGQPETAAFSRPITTAGLDAYRALIRSLLALGRRQGVALRWWTPWNEPNNFLFISPQRLVCSPHGTAVSPATYARLARAMRAELAAAPERPRMVIGELADIARPSEHGTAVPEFWRALPDDVVCSAAVYSQHEYARSHGRKQGKAAVGRLEEMLAARPCARGKPIWVTETGAGGTHVGTQRGATPAAQRQDCRSLNDLWAGWRADPHVQAAFQYTFRDDPIYPVGLADAELTHTWPTYALVRAWGGRRDPNDPAPPLPAACSKED
jgi:hypothetical protein